MKWWAGNQHRFMMPVRVEAVDRRGIRLSFTPEFTILYASLTSDSISVMVEVDGICWDMLLSLDAFPCRSDGGYRCAFCEPSGQIWPTRDALWIDHLFEPFLQWVNNRLPHLSAIKLGRTEGGSTWAEIVRHPAHL